MIPEATSHPLPPYRGLLAVDISKYTRNRDRYLPELSRMIPGLLEEAFGRCGQEPVWRERRFPDHPGDGYVFGLSPRHLPSLIHPFLDTLQATLWEHASGLRARDRSLSLRLRVAMHVGPVHDADDPLRDRKAKATNDTFRLLNSTPLKDVMDATEPDVTLVAAIISQRVFQDVVEGGYTAVHASQFRQVTAEVADKDFAEPAWIYVPRLTFSEGASMADRRPVDGPVAEDARTGATAIFHDRVGQSFTGGTFHGGIHYQEG